MVKACKAVWRRMLSAVALAILAGWVSLVLLGDDSTAKLDSLRRTRRAKVPIGKDEDFLKDGGQITFLQERILFAANFRNDKVPVAESMLCDVNVDATKREAFVEELTGLDAHQRRGSDRSFADVLREGRDVFGDILSGISITPGGADARGQGDGTSEICRFTFLCGMDGGWWSLIKVARFYRNAGRDDALYVANKDLRFSGGALELPLEADRKKTVENAMDKLLLEDGHEYIYSRSYVRSHAQEAGRGSRMSILEPALLLYDERYFAHADFFTICRPYVDVIPVGGFPETCSGFAVLFSPILEEELVFSSGRGVDTSLVEKASCSADGWLFLFEPGHAFQKSRLRVLVGISIPHLEKEWLHPAPERAWETWKISLAK